MKQMKIGWRLSTSLVLAVLVTAAFSTVISAHPASDFYSYKWPSTDRNVDWSFDQEFPTDGKRDRAKDGAQQWNNVGTTMTFNKLSGDWGGYAADVCPTQEQKDGLHWGTIDGGGGTLARTYRCVSGSNLHSFQIKYDQAENWHGGTTDPGPNEADFWSVSAHEFGHATGWNGHFSGTSSYCNANSTDHHTLCPTTYLGTKWDRSLNTHDVHTFDNAY